MKVGIPLSHYAYTPEAYAYEKYLTKLGYQTQLDYELDPNNDVNIYFMGSRPFWKKNGGRAKEIHEYQSLSTPPYAKVKNYAKKLINKPPSGRIFLNDFVHRDLNFNDNIPFLYRDMGVDENLFQKPIDNPLYDIVYCGSISGRSGLIDVLLRLAQTYKVVVVGQLSNQEKLVLCDIVNITILGKVTRDELPEIYRNCKYGLNYTPDIYPYNIQTSTKTLEYLASGLGVISNRYQWVEFFFKKIDYQPIWLSLNNNIDLYNFVSVKMDVMKPYSWQCLLENSGFANFINEL